MKRTKAFEDEDRSDHLDSFKEPHFPPWQIVENRAVDIYRRPYLPPGQAEKTFLLLRSLAATCPPDASPRASPTTKHSSPSPNGPHSNEASPRGATLACHVANVLGACMDELTAYAGKASAVLWEGAGMLAGIPGSPATNSGVGPLGRGTLVFGGGPRALTGTAATTVTRAVSNPHFLRFQLRNKIKARHHGLQVRRVRRAQILCKFSRRA